MSFQLLFRVERDNTCDDINVDGISHHVTMKRGKRHATTFHRSSTKKWSTHI